MTTDFKKDDYVRGDNSLFWKPVGFNEVDGKIIIEVPIKYLSSGYINFFRKNKDKLSYLGKRLKTNTDVISPLTIDIEKKSPDNS